MVLRFPLLFLAILVTLSGIAWEKAEAQVYFRRPHYDLMRDQQIRHLYRPSIRVVRPAGQSRAVKSGGSLRYSFYVRRGWVDRIEVRSGLKVIKTVRPGKARSGGGSIRVTASDLARAGKGGKSQRIKLWAWQGQPGRQSVHGETPPIKFYP